MLPLKEKRGLFLSNNAYKTQISLMTRIINLSAFLKFVLILHPLVNNFFLI